MVEQERTTFAWTDLVWLVLLAGLALLEPIREYHKQLVLLGIGLFQIFETRLLGTIPLSRRGPYAVLIKILLATLLVAHTGDIESSYYLIYYLPVVSAAMYFDILGTLLWTLVASLAYCSFLIPALREFQLAPGGANELAIRNLFFFPVGIVVNRFVIENRRQVWRYQKLAAALAETNRRLEKAQADARRSERLAALGQLSAGLAHEIRNPLGVIKGSAETLAKKLPSADPLAAELAGYISSEVNRLNALVSRFLDFARPLRLERHPTEIPPLVDRALKSAHDRWPEAKIEVEHVDSASLPQVPVDAELCEQVFTNLVHNAYQAMSPGGGKLSVRVMPAQADGRRGVEVSFEDSGTGIAADVREQIFNPFFTTKKEGVGLGLSIVSKIVDEHRGTISVTSEPGHGACFRVFLPVE